MSTSGFFIGRGIGWGELRVLAILGVGVLGVLGLVVFIAVKEGQNSKERWVGSHDPGPSW